MSNAIAGSKTVEQVLTDAATRHERTLERAGHKIDRKGNAPEVPDTLISPVGMDAVVPVNN